MISGLQDKGVGSPDLIFGICHYQKVYVIRSAKVSESQVIAEFY
jgi:hypothetical protein